MNQIGLEVKVPQRKTRAAVRRARVWQQAILRIAAKLRHDGIDVKRFSKPLLPAGATDAWIVKRAGVPYRCVYMYTINPRLDGYPFVGRVDVVYE